MSNLTAPLRVFLHREREWHWFEQQERSFVAIKETLMAALMAFYDPKQELTLQVDASLTGVGAALIQGDRPCRLCIKGTHPYSAELFASREGVISSYIWMLQI